MAREAYENRRINRKIFEGIAHMPMVEAPEKTAKLMRRLVSRTTSATEPPAGED